MKIKISGYASYYNFKDYQNDVIKPGAFDDEINLFNQHKKKLLLLMHHNQQLPLATIDKIISDTQGLWIETIIDCEKEDPLIKFIDNNLITDFSVGIIPLEYYHEKSMKIIKKAQLLEISLVTIGANRQCKIINKEIS